MRMIRMMTLALALGLMAGCASAAADGGPGTDGDLAVRVENDLIPSTSLTVWLVSETGTRQMLGTVPAGATRTLAANPRAFGGDYRLLAETTLGDELWSHPFMLPDGTSRLSWDMSANIVTSS